jgi:hypothetical protein
LPGDEDKPWNYRSACEPKIADQKNKGKDSSRSGKNRASDERFGKDSCIPNFLKPPPVSKKNNNIGYQDKQKEEKEKKKKARHYTNIYSNASSIVSRFSYLTR